METRKLIRNFGYLTLLQVVNLAFPILTFPYIVKIVGTSYFGEISLSQAIASFMIIIINFGFDLSVTPEIAKNKNDVIVISNYFYSVMILKFFLFIFSLLGIMILTIYLPTLYNVKTLLLYSIGNVVGVILFPTWLFLGMEQMKFITFFNLTTKIAITLLIFIYVKEKTCYHLVLLFNCIVGIIGGVFGFIWSILFFKIPLSIPSQKTILSVFLNSKNYFLSRIANDGSRYFATIFIGLNFSSTLVGYYSIVDKIFATSISIGGIGSQALYPLMSRKKDVNLFLNVLKYTVLSSVLFLFFIYTFKGQILFFFFKSDSPILFDIYDSVLWCILIANISSLIGYPLLGAWGYANEANFSLIYASIFYLFYIVLATILTKNILLLSISVCIYEMIAFLIRLYFISKYQILKK
ncbi:hypothetical protein DR864_26035 [Runella rosea]|uniref:Flippase n=1 Tax=Runella rosea TaxID=2259595 RepID=A0A344TQN2_9BACT|nr:oligosaccharide flippase family protein [Runella rosea]AXE20953.1 hypothetical protein DR864_26035 [Runella rosea]